MNANALTALRPSDVLPMRRELSVILRRPSSVGAIAALSWANLKETPDGAGGPRWRLEGSPAVVMLAKKLFSGALSRRSDYVSWPATRASFEDLLMLMHRYPVEVAAGATQRVWNEQWADLTWSHEARLGIIDVAVGGGAGRFNGTLMAFQEEGVAFGVAGRRSLNCDEVGLGKTVQALAWLNRLDDWPAVIVCQPHLQRHWRLKIPEFLDARLASELPGLDLGLTWMRLRGTTPGRPGSGAMRAHIYVVHYLVLYGWANWLVDRGVRSVVFDEVQETRHTGTAKSDACRKIAKAGRNVLGLSGTPIYNKGIEMHSVMDCIDRGSLGTRAEFKENWGREGDADLVEDPALLGQYLRDRGLMIRRRKEDVLSELPDCRRVVEMIDGDNERFATLVTEARRLAREAVTIKDPFDRARMEAEAINGARLATGIAKAPAVLLFLLGLLEAEQPTLFFAHHHAVVDEIMGGLRKHKPVAITGRQTMAQKSWAQEAFMAGETNLCLISLRSATGLDGFQHRARVVAFGELDWSPAVMSQAIGRAHRMGLRDSVLAYYLVADLGTDPFMLEALKVKEAQSQGILQDRPETAEDRERADAAAKEHMAAVLRMLRGE